VEFPEPIIILGSPRSGTSLTASIFAIHDVWVGTSRVADESNPAYYENLALAELRYQHCYDYLMGHGKGLDKTTVHETILMDRYTGGPWLVKHSPPTWRAWLQFSPTWIFVRREPRTIVKSRIRCGQWPMTEEEHWIAVESDIGIMNAIKNHVGGLDVYPDLFFENDWCGLDKVIAAFNPQYAVGQLNAEIWH
jgi:hypothetical protein